MMLWFRKRGNDFANTSLLDQDSFYPIFTQDLLIAKQEVIIESPFLTTRRVGKLLPTLQKLSKKGVRIVINTKPLDEHEVEYCIQAQQCVAWLHGMGATVLFTGGHHRKLAIIDRQILYEGSLNILSQNDSCEIMRRIDSARLAMQTISFVGIGKFIK